MNEGLFKNKEKLDIRVEMAKPEDWETCKVLKLESLKGKDAYKFGVTPDNKEERIKKEEDKGEQEWKDRLVGDNVFGVLAWSGTIPMGIGLVKAREDKED